jgi:hypothetical protein
LRPGGKFAVTLSARRRRSLLANFQLLEQVHRTERSKRKLEPILSGGLYRTNVFGRKGGNTLPKRVHAGTRAGFVPYKPPCSAAVTDSCRAQALRTDTSICWTNRS